MTVKRRGQDNQWEGGRQTMGGYGMPGKKPPRDLTPMQQRKGKEKTKGSRKRKEVERGL